MKRRIAAAKTLVLILCLFLVNSIFVVAFEDHEFVDPHNSGNVVRFRQQIHELAQVTREVLGIRSPNFHFHNGHFPFNDLEGICAVVHIEGVGTFLREEYIMGVVLAEMGAEWDKPEALKAQAIAARTYLINSRKNSDTCTVPNSTSYQAFRNIDTAPQRQRDPIIAAVNETAGIVIMRDGEIASGFYQSYPNPVHWTNANGVWRIQFERFPPDASTQWEWVGPDMEEVLGAGNFRSRPANCTWHNKGMSQVIAIWMADNGSSFMEILETFYGTPTTTFERMRDTDMSGVGGPTEGRFAGTIRNYNQKDFENHFFSANPSMQQFARDNGTPATIASHGGGPTALAIVLSSLTGSEINPVRVTRELCSIGGCSNSGTDFPAMAKLANNYGFRTRWGDSDEALSRLSTGDSLVIVMMGPGYFTRGEHFIVLTGINSNGLVKVSDPASVENTNADGFPVNMIVDQRVRNRDFLIITRQ